MQTMDHVDVSAGDGFKRPRLMLSILEVAFLMRREARSKPGGD